MAENVKFESRDPLQLSAERESRAYELRFEPSNGEIGPNSASNSEEPHMSDLCMKSDSRVFSGAGSNAARYKLMSPARLPISRSPCLTIPPGLSPTSLLDSPVLLSNLKAEPSPTTGTFNKSHFMHDDTFASNSLRSPRENSNTITHNERSCGGFEFKPHIRSSLGSGLSSLGHMASAGLNHQQHEPFGKIQGQCQTQTFTSSSSAKSENMPASHELSLCVTTPDPSSDAVVLRSSASAEVAPCDLWQKPGPENGVQTQQSDRAIPSTVADRSSEDGYNWRKYGQKLVKGCEFPRSYYKCTHPNCQVKKQLERSHDGQITEIIYKGNHDHPKPQPNRRAAVGSMLSVQEEGSDRLSALNSSEDKSLNAHGQSYHQNEPTGTPDFYPVRASDDNADGTDAPSNRIVNEGDDDDDDDPDSKRRKTDMCGVDVTLMGKVTREPRVVVQTLSEVDILDDGYRWRKYGQKVVKGNPNPRSYYKCTNAGCPVRKHVERASHDPKAVITTYEGKHNHDVPAAKNSNHDTAPPAVYNSAMNGMLRTRSEEIDTISLDLGVGISSSPENRSNERHQPMDAEPMYNPSYMADPGCSSKMIQVYCGGLPDGNNQYGSREVQGESFSFETRPLNHSSNPYQQNMGRLMMGP